MKKLKVKLLKYPQIFNLIFSLYSFIRYPHFILVGLILKLNNNKIKFRDFNFSVPRKNTSPFFLGSCYFIGTEQDEVLAIEKYLNKKAKVLELGGCLGFVSCFLNRKLENNKNHIVLEANPKLIPYLEMNKKTNECGYHIVNKIISNKKKNLFYVAKSIHSSSTKKRSKEEYIIEGTTLVDLEKEYEMTFDTLVMDIEGAEFDLLTDTDFSKLNITTIIFELHDFNGVLTSEQVNEIKITLNKYKFKHVETIGSSQVWLKN